MLKGILEELGCMILIIIAAFAVVILYKFVTCECCMQGIGF